MRVLLVDDEQSLLMTLAANLELDGFDVTTAQSGLEALQLFERETFDLVLSDVRMPGMNGVELFRRIRKLRPECPVVLMTGFALEDLVRQAIAEGVFTVLPKPLDVEHLARALTSAVKSPVVLVLDGDAPVAEKTAAGLRKAGVRAAHFTAAQEALATIRGGSVDVCVVDLNLEGAGATGLIEQIQRIDPTIIHIAVAGRNVAGSMRQAAASGSFVCMRKPVDANDLVEVIARARGSRPKR